MKSQWSRLGGQLGVGLCAIGFLFVFLGWNGAASVDRVPSQFPYLISGGVAGLCFVVMGVGMIIVQNQRADRAELQKALKGLQDSLEQAGIADSTAPVDEFSPPPLRPTPPEVAAAVRGVEVEESSVSSERADDVEVELEDDVDAADDTVVEKAPSKSRPRRRKPIRADS